MLSGKVAFYPFSAYIIIHLASEWNSLSMVYVPTRWNERPTIFFGKSQCLYEVSEVHAVHMNICITYNVWLTLHLLASSVHAGFIGALFVVYVYRLVPEYHIFVLQL